MLRNAKVCQGLNMLRNVKVLAIKGENQMLRNAKVESYKYEFVDTITRARKC